jgi:hypothetical protein
VSTHGGRTFDRIVRFDPRSRDYPIRALVDGRPRRSYTWRCDAWLDQGREGACTGFAVSHEAAARPVAVPGITNAVARQVYIRARQLDDIPGEDYDGSTVLGAMKAGLERGWYSEYRWAFGEGDLALAVGYAGPAVLGVSWYEGMMEPDPLGVIRPAGRVVGGHAILCVGYSKPLARYRLRNSWGRGWGRNGDCFISARDLSRLLQAGGEACIPVVRKGGT